MRKLIMTGIIVAALAAVGVFTYIVVQRRIRDSILDGPDMVYKGIGLPEEVQGLWVSDTAPQWSLRAGKDRIVLDHYGTETCSVPLQNYEEFDESGKLPELITVSTAFEWPYSGADHAEITHVDIFRDRISVLVETDDGRRQTLWFEPAAEGTTVKQEREALPEGVTLQGMKFHQTGSADDIWFSISELPEGYEVRMSYDEPFWMDMDGYDGENESGGRVSRVIVEQDEINDLMDRLLEYDILSWDGFDRSESLEEGLLDGDSGFELKMLLSDGRIVSAEGYNVFPPNNNAIIGILTGFFYDHEDYSSYYPDEFPGSDPAVLEILCPAYTDNRTEYFRIELYSSGKWAFSFQDPEGHFLDAGTNISEYGFAEGLPFDRYIRLLKEYGFEAYNQTECRDGDTKQYLSITLHFEDGKEYTYLSNVYPENYDEFRKELVMMMYKDYLKLKEQQ
ncbi:MAG: hypothetical protein K6E41_03455 [Solobacterium sp.]|nr:hypothetical protein [Solobacterium sp.]